MSQPAFAGRFVWHELATPDIDAAIAFYGRVLGWTARPVPDLSYTVMLANGREAAGIRAAFPQEPPGWIGYVGLADVDTMAARIPEAGGSICHAPDDIPGIGRFAVAQDPFGAPFNLFKPLPVDPPAPAAPGTPGHVGWNELRAGEWQRAFEFYAGLFGWTKDQAIDMGDMGTYQIFAIGGVPSGGMMSIGACPGGVSPSQLSPSWMFYWNVAAIDATVSTITASGGTVTQGPMEVPGGSHIVQACDPQDIAFAVVQPANRSA